MLCHTVSARFVVWVEKTQCVLRCFKFSTFMMLITTALMF